MAFENILTGDTFNEGRIKINEGFNEFDLWDGTSYGNTVFINSQYPNSTTSEQTPSEGYNTVFGANNIAVEVNPIFNGTSNVVIGYSNTSKGNVSHAEGYLTTTLGNYCHAGGFNTTVSGSSSFIHSRKQSSTIASGVDSAVLFQDGSAILGGSDSSIINYRDAYASYNDGEIGGHNCILGSKEVYITAQDDPDNNAPVGSTDKGQSGYSVIVGCNSDGPNKEIYNEGVYGSALINTSFSYVKQNGDSDFGVSISTSNAIIGGRRGQIENSDCSTIIGSGKPGLGSTPYNFIKKAKVSSIISSLNSNIDNDSAIYSSIKHSVISGGEGNLIAIDIGTGGQDDLTEDTILNSVIIGGNGNTIAKYYEVFTNTAETVNNCAIIGGENNDILGGRYHQCVIVGGSENKHRNTVLYNNSPQNNVILGGENNVISSGSFGTPSNCVVLGGKNKDLTKGLTADLNVSTVIAGQGFKSSRYSVLASNSFQAGYSLATIPTTAARTIYLDWQNGNGYWDGSLSVGTADYAEYFEWQDGNINNEERYGYAVSLVGDKIEIGNSDIVGIVSPTPGFIGDSASLKWKDFHLKDEFRRKLKIEYKKYIISGQTSVNNIVEPYEIIDFKNLDKLNKLSYTGRTSNVDDSEIVEFYIDEDDNIYKNYPSAGNLDGILYTGSTEGKVYVGNIFENKINPNFDKDQEYLSREERKEWSPIGLLGKLHVRTSEQITGNNISFDINGEAINGTDYHVLKSIKDYDGDYGIVQILFK